MVDQAPAGGATAQLGTLVTLRVSSGKAPTVMIPAVAGQDAAAARTVLEEMGFVVRVQETAVSDPKQDGVVLGTMPKAGTKVDRGSVVTMNVGVKQQNRPLTPG